MAHIVLLGDSSLDNAAYAPIGEDISSHIKNEMSGDWQLTVLAKDGSMMRDVYRQLSRIPTDATHLVLSVGGGDVLKANEILDQPANSIGEALNKFANLGDDFEVDYMSLLRSVRAKGFRTILCTISYPNFQEATVQRRSEAALTFFNDAIIRTAFDTFTTLIDLRLLLGETSDYANEFVPSSQGGRKIANMIVGVVSQHR